MYICIFDCSVYSDRYVEVEHDICCDREKNRDYTLMKVKSVFFPYRNIYIYIYIYSNFDLRKTVLNT